MDNLVDWIKIAAIVAGIIILVLIILLSLPNSRLRKWLLKIVGSLLVGVMVLAIVYIASPVDFLPDVIPGLGQVDDLGALIIGVLNLAGGMIMLSQKPKPTRKRISRSKS
jgi:multisubunit Na+/H+ antiporter MnhB subunit